MIEEDFQKLLLKNSTLLSFRTEKWGVHTITRYLLEFYIITTDL